MNRDTRQAVLERDGRECQNCGVRVGNADDELPTAEIHHKTPLHDGGEDRSENLITLCPNCHSKKPGRESGAGGGRPRDPPLSDEVLATMVPNRCYVVADLVAEFEEQYDPSRGTIRNRLEYLVEEGEVERKKHANDTVTYRRPEHSEDRE